MDAPTAGHFQALSLGALVTEGKTKKIFRIVGSDLVSVVAKDDITAGDGAKHDVIPDKGRLATATTCNVFRLLKACGLPVAFEEQDSALSFVAPGCTMLPYEVVIRREAHGSYLKRNPHFAKGQLFPRLIVEFFLKTKDKNWKGKPLICDDPLMNYAEGGSDIRLFNPAKPMHGQEPFLVLPASEVLSRPDEWKIFPEMERIARHAFLALEKAWQLAGGTLVDLKVEFGFDTKGRLLLADVIDNDSWRVLENGAYIDKQVYRDGGALDDVAEKYRRVADSLFGGACRPRRPHDHRDPLGPQGAGGGGEHAAQHGAGGAGLGRDRLYRAVERRRPDPLGAHHDPGDHRAGEREGIPRGRLVVAARAQQRAGHDGARAVQRGAGRAADPVRPQSPHLRPAARRDREPHAQYRADLRGAWLEGAALTQRRGVVNNNESTSQGPPLPPLHDTKMRAWSRWQQLAAWRSPGA